MSATVRDELAGKPANEVEQSTKESVGRRAGTKRNADQQKHAPGTEPGKRANWAG